MATENTRLTAMLGLEHPLIMAPMFLVSNVAMVEAKRLTATMRIRSPKSGS